MKSFDSVESKIKALTEENIFAVKFKQISAEKDDLTVALLENCPATRTVKEAQAYVTKKIGSNYTLSKCLGVGTIAETYLAKDKNGREVCIKILKEGISKEKIANDRKKFIDIINNLENKTQAEKEYLIKNIDDLAEAISKEIDFNNEKTAAEKLVKFTKSARVVKPIEVKNGVYIMEKANGISLNTLVKLNKYQSEKQYYERCIKNLKEGKLSEWEEKHITLIQKTKEEYIQSEIKFCENEIEKITQKIKQIQSRTPEYGDINLSQADVKYMFEEYMKVITEQFYKVDKTGKTLHADIHPGNVFIDINALKSRKGKIFTLIDTGNTIDLTVKQSMDSIKLTSFIERGSVKDIANYVCEGAVLPKGMTKEEAIAKVEKELAQCFFDNKTALEPVTNSNLLNMTANIMRKYGIMPSSNQLNLDKARTSADNSFIELLKLWFNKVGQNIRGQDSNTQKGKEMFKAGVEWLKFDSKFKKMKANQEKLNLLQMSPQDALRYKNNPNLLKTNSEEYLTYKLKQHKKRELPKIESAD